MNNRLKFRVFDKETNKMFTPSRHFNLCNINGTIVCIESYADESGFMKKRISKEYSDAILMQCTDLKDANGKLIYEKDLLKDNKGQIGMIFYKGGSYCVNWHMEDGSYETDSCWGCGEIVGNIYENPDLFYSEVAQ